jgi:hypothetical protein
MANPVHLDDTDAGEATRTAHEIDTTVREPALLPSIGILRHHEVTPGEGCRDIDIGDSGCLTCTVDGLARTQEGLGGDARPVRALASNKVTLDHGDTETPFGKCSSTVLARSPAPQDDDVVVVACLVFAHQGLRMSVSLCRASGLRKHP